MNVSAERRTGIIGGTGFSERALDYETVPTDYGDVRIGHLDLGGKDVIFVARHQALQIPSHVNYRANAEALKILGVNAVFTVSAAGRMAENVLPGHLVNVSDVVWYGTGKRETTFAEDGALIMHVPLAGLYSEQLREMINQSWPSAEEEVREIYGDDPGLAVGFHRQGVYFNSEPPWFNTEAREAWLRATVPNLLLIGQTQIPEAPLLREMGIAVATLGVCTDHSTFPGAVRVSHAGEGGVMDIAQKTSLAALAVLEKAIELTPDDFYDPAAHEMHVNAVSPNQVNLPKLRERRPRLAVIISEALAEQARNR